jgi:hypothetical protein
MLVTEGSRLVIGEAVIERSNGKLVLSDRYSKSTYLVGKDAEVKLVPAPPFNVPQRVSDYLMMVFKTPLVVTDKMTLWVEGPYEIAVVVEGSIVKYLSPIKVKHALYGDVVDGLVCRYFETPILNEPFGKTTVASSKIILEGEVTKEVNKLVIPIKDLRFFESNGRFYYEVIEAELNEESIDIELTREPPIPNAIPIRKVVHPKTILERTKFSMRW